MSQAGQFLIWQVLFLVELRFPFDFPAGLLGDNQASIASSLITLIDEIRAAHRPASKVCSNLLDRRCIHACRRSSCLLQRCAAAACVRMRCAPAVCCVHALRACCVCIGPMLIRQWDLCKCVGLCRSTAFCAEDLPRPTKSPLSTQQRTPT
jgi:hypothetical protein